MNTYKVKREDLIGQLEGFPIEIAQEMVDEQARQGNKVDVSIFQICVEASETEYGFDWSCSKDGMAFWEDIIMEGNFSTFFKKYPKDIEPCDFCEGQHCTALYDRDGSDVRVMDNELCIDSFMRCGDCNNASQFYTEIRINYCPMCGRKLEKFKN